MANGTVLQLLRTLEKYTDREHSLSKEEILQIMQDDYDVCMEEKAFYRKIDELEGAGFAVVKTKGRYSRYYLNTHRLSSSELLYLSVLLYGSSNISSGEAKQIVDTLGEMDVHQNSKSDCSRYRDKLRANNMRTRQIEKFASLLRSMEQHMQVSYKVVLDLATNSFSETRIGNVVDFFVSSNLVYFVIDNSGTRSTYQLKELINVEEIS